MSKAYSNKALPAGTVLREWRLEQVLGVGGFGIVYKGRGIYFDELVAIKEYFPSSISERVDGDTVVPIDSDAEEVHALGLKKFVEEAKLLWNLSTPTRHPNIVSVRSLFEIHGTAYMVMDFEDGVSLSNLLKHGNRWNEASLTAMFRPIAEGLERAHRVGVLHRDIKPPNILITPDSRPVLIDFGSARFESGDATSTKVTFHTPPYAAIEQYVRTYQQGPWTDIYALGVVLYECITGTKPPEVLERMHGGLGKALSEGEWPGYSRKFLNAVNAAMAIRPDERPQSISQWLALFDAPDEDDAAEPVDEFDGDATRVAAFASEEIQPVAPPPPGFTRGERIGTPVPDDPSEVKFKRAGEDTNSSKKAEVAGKLAPVEAEAPAQAAEPAAPGAAKATEPGKRKGAGSEAAGTTAKRRPSPALLGLSALALAGLGAGGWYFAGKPGVGARAPDPAMVGDALDLAPVDVESAGGIAPALQALADDAGKANAPSAAIAGLSATIAQLGAMQPSQETEKGPLAMKALAGFATAIATDADARARRLARDLPWANPRTPAAAANETPERARLARTIRTSLSGIRDASAAAAAAADLDAALAAAQQAMAHNSAFNAAIARAYRSGNVTPPANVPTDPVTETTQAPAEAASETAATIEPVSDGGTAGRPSRLFPAKFRNFNSIVRSARDMADDTIGLGRGREPDAGASDEERERYRVRQANAQSAREYRTYLDSLENSMRGERTEAEVDLNIANAERARGYLRDLREASRAARRR